MTKGEKRVAKSFNPSANPLVESLKELGAEQIDALEELMEGASGEKKRSISLAQSQIEIATMLAVKAVFVD